MNIRVQLKDLVFTERQGRFGAFQIARFKTRLPVKARLGHKLTSASVCGSVIVRVRKTKD